MRTSTQSAEILVIEDNEPVRRFIAAQLEQTGYTVREAGTGEEAFAVLRNRYLDLVLLDLKLGDVHGMEILRTIRRQNEDLPVMIVSSTQDLNVKVDGFDVGCDDYITKPFHVTELLGRIKRLLRRTARSRSGDAAEDGTVVDGLTVGPFYLDLRNFTVSKYGRPLAMRKKLFDLFLHFARNPDVVVSKESLYENVWDVEDDISDNSLYVHIHQLRARIEDAPSHPVHLKTVRGLGFSFHPAGRSR